MRNRKLPVLDSFSEQPYYNAAADREQNVIGQAIAAARKRRGLSREALCLRLSRQGLHIQRTGLYRWENGDSVPNAYQLMAVCHELEIRDPLQAFTTLPAGGELLNEEGLRKLEEYKQDLIASGRYRPAPPAEEIRYIPMPVSTLAASAGTGEFLDEGNFEQVLVPATSVPPGADFGVRVSGDSMEPVYQDGQLVWVEICESIQKGEVGLFMYDGGGYIKVYGENSGDSETFTDSDGVRHPQPVLISYNQQYSPKPVLPELPFSLVGRVLS